MHPDAPTSLEQALERLAAKDALISELRTDLTTKDASLKIVDAALIRIREVVGVPIPTTPDGVIWSVETLLGASEGHALRADRAERALTRICEIIGAPTPVCPEDAVEAVAKQLGDDNDADARAKEAEQALKDINLALDDAGAPQAYHLEDDTERGIPDPERIRLLGERIHTLRAQVREAADATNYLDALIEAHNALDVLKAPRLADGCVLSLAARIRSLYR